MFDILKSEMGDPAWIICDYLLSNDMIVYDGDSNLLKAEDRVVIWKKGSITLPFAKDVDHKIIVHGCCENMGYGEMEGGIIIQTSDTLNGAFITSKGGGGGFTKRGDEEGNVFCNNYSRCEFTTDGENTWYCAIYSYFEKTIRPVYSFNNNCAAIN